MSSTLENTAIVVGSFSLLAVCFVGLSVVGSHRISVPAGDEPEAQAVAEHVLQRAEPPPQRAGFGLLEAWRLPAPYSEEELRGLVDELQRETERVRHREQELDRRERHVEERLATLAERARELQELRAGRGFEGPVSEPVPADGGTSGPRPRPLRERGAERWLEVARLLASMPVREAKLILARYSPEEAAAILNALDDEFLAAELLAALRTVPSIQSWKEYVDAYSRLEQERSSG